MNTQLQKKVDRAVHLLQSAQKAYPDEIIEVSYSGGKDSDVILELAKMAGIKYEAIYKNTTIDPPGTIRHAEEIGATILRPKMSFFDLVVKKGYPTRRARFCCEYLKEYKVRNVAVQGIRRSESSARAKRYTEPQICRIYRNKEERVKVFLPILDWTDRDVADFIEERQIKCAPIYYDDNGVFHVERRLGCMGCPMASDNGLSDFKKYPKLAKAWIRGAHYLRMHPQSSCRTKFRNEYELFVHNVFFDSYQEFREAVDGMFGTLDCKKFIEDYFNIKL